MPLKGTMTAVDPFHPLQTPPPTPQQPVRRGNTAPGGGSPTKQHELLQKLAVARLKHTVSELEDQVEFDRRNSPLPAPKPTALHLVPDASALTTSISDIKTYVSDESAKVTIPLCLLDSLDKVKRGSTEENINARETVRWFDKVLTSNTPVKGVKFQKPDEVYGRWEECLEWYNPLTSTAAVDDVEEIAFASPLAMTESQMLAQTTTGLNDLSISPSPPGSPTIGVNSSASNAAPAMPPRILKSANTFHHAGTGATPRNLALPRSATAPIQDPPSPTSSLHAPEVPRKIQPIINCALEILHSETTEFSKNSEGVFFLVTNNPETSHWAQSFGIPVLNTKELSSRIAEEKRLYKQRKRDWENTNSANSRVVMDANGFGNRDLKSPKANGHGRGGGGRRDRDRDREPAAPRGGGDQTSETHQPSGRRRNRHNQNAQRGSNNNTNTANATNGHTTGNGNGSSFRGGRGGFQGGGTFGRNSGAMLQEKAQSSNGGAFSTSPTQQHGHRNHHNHGNHNHNNGHGNHRDNTNNVPTGILGRGGMVAGGENGEPEYVLGRGANRGVARGKGKLWVP